MIGHMQSWWSSRKFETRYPTILIKRFQRSSHDLCLSGVNLCLWNYCRMTIGSHAMLSRKISSYSERSMEYCTNIICVVNVLLWASSERRVPSLVFFQTKLEHGTFVMYKCVETSQRRFLRPVVNIVCCLNAFLEKNRIWDSCFLYMRCLGLKLWFSQVQIDILRAEKITVRTFSKAKIIFCAVAHSFRFHILRFGISFIRASVNHDPRTVLGDARDTVLLRTFTSTSCCSLCSMVYIDADHAGFVYSPVNDRTLEIPKFPPATEKVRMRRTCISVLCRVSLCFLSQFVF